MRVSVIFFILAASLLLRLPAFIMPHTEGDEVIYQTLAAKTAKNFLDYSAQGTGIVEWTASPLYDTKLFIHPPLFVWALALFHKAGLSDLAVAVPIISALAVILITFLIAKEIGLGDYAYWAAMILAFDPVLFFTSSKILIEAPLTALATLSVYLLLLAVRRQHGYFFFASGLAFGLAFLTKYLAITIGPALLYIFWTKQTIIKRPLRKFLLFSAATAAVAVPWLVFYSVTAGFGDLFGLQTTAEYLNRFPFVQMVVSRPWHAFFSYSLLVAPVYFISWFGLTKIIRRGGAALPAVWALSVFTIYTLVVYFTRAAGYSIRYLAPATPAMALLAALGVRENRKLARLIWPLLFIGLAGGLLSVYSRPGIGDVFPVLSFIL